MRLVASDIDGTILDHSGLISPRVVSAFRACQDSGVEVVFVTGRPFRMLRPLVEQIGHAGAAICSNGSLVYDLAEERVVSAHHIPVEAARRAAEALRQTVPNVSFALETIGGFRLEPGYGGRSPAGVADPGEDPEGLRFEELLADEPVIVKMMAFTPTGTSDELLAVAEPLIGSYVSPTHSNPNGSLIEISPHGVNKAQGLSAFTAERGIAAADVVAFGDMPNDIEMLAWAGRGFAMTGGHPDAIAAAGALAPSLAEDGVAQVLERLLAESSRAAG